MSVRYNFCILIELFNSFWFRKVYDKPKFNILKSEASKLTVSGNNVYGYYAHSSALEKYQPPWIQFREKAQSS